MKRRVVLHLEQEWQDPVGYRIIKGSFCVCWTHWPLFLSFLFASSISVSLALLFSVSLSVSLIFLCHPPISLMVAEVESFVAQMRMVDVYL